MSYFKLNIMIVRQYALHLYFIAFQINYCLSRNLLTFSLTKSILVRHKIYQVCHFSSLYIFCLGCKTISRRAARRLILFHPRQNLESGLKCQICFSTLPSEFSCSSGKGLNIRALSRRFSAHFVPICTLAKALHPWCW